MNNYMNTAGNYSGIGTNKLLGKSFLWMFAGMLISGAAAWFTYSSGLWMSLFTSGTFYMLIFGELVAVVCFSLLFRRLAAPMVTFLYLLYALLNGVVLSSVFVVYELGSIVMIFGISALAFGALGLIGYNTRKDMTGWGVYLSVFLIAAVLIEAVNIFLLRSSFTQVLINAGVLTLFFAITIYDVNKLKNTQNYGYYDVSKAHIYFAMELYLDFINIFLRLLALFGKERS